MIRAPSRTCAAAVLLITLASLASTTTALAEVKHGEEPFWHFAVRMSDENGVLVSQNCNLHGVAKACTHSTLCGRAAGKRAYGAWSGNAAI